MLLTTLVLHLLLGRYMVAAEVGARAATKGSMANGGRNSVWIRASGSLGTVTRYRRAPLRGALRALSTFNIGARVCVAQEQKGRPKS